MATPAPNADFDYPGPDGPEDGGDTQPTQRNAAAEPFTSTTRSPFHSIGTPGSAGALRVPREKAYRLCAQLLIGDWISACSAIYSGLALREWQRNGWALKPSAFIGFQPQVTLWTLGGATLFLWMMAILKTYEVRNLYRLQLWWRNLATSVIMWCVAAWACVGLFQVSGFAPRIGVVYCALALGVYAIVWRLFCFTFLMRPEVKEAASTRVIMVGWNKKASHMRKAMRQDIAQLSEIIGCVPMPDGTFSTTPPSEIAVLGAYQDLSRLLVECGADSIILSDVTCSAHEIQLLIQFCQRELIAFQMVPEYFPELNAALEVQTLSGVPLLGVGPLPLDRTGNRLIKRAMDIAGAMLGLTLSVILVPLAGVMVYIEAPGPLLRRERRASRSGRAFDTFKVRTGKIEHGRERLPGRLGRLVQKLDLDEFPQFWNVLIGDMSLVGPYPEHPDRIARLTGEVPNYSLRHDVRPGLTGWSQVNGVKGDIDVARRVEGDLYYLRNWNVMVDVYCIAATLFRSGSTRLVQVALEQK
jgi:lipopolysaccharide/colanic/teichoic acid biosynthesis glycosyltransferase